MFVIETVSLAGLACRINCLELCYKIIGQRLLRCFGRPTSTTATVNSDRPAHDMHIDSCSGKEPKKLKNK